jgi:hypothetical protein
MKISELDSKAQGWLLLIENYFIHDKKKAKRYALWIDERYALRIELLFWAGSRRLHTESSTKTKMKDDDLIYDTLLTWRGGFGNIVAKIKMQC